MRMPPSHQPLWPVAVRLRRWGGKRRRKRRWLRPEQAELPCQIALTFGNLITVEIGAVSSQVSFCNWRNTVGGGVDSVPAQPACSLIVAPHLQSIESCAPHRTEFGGVGVFICWSGLLRTGHSPFSPSHRGVPVTAIGRVAYRVNINDRLRCPAPSSPRSWLFVVAGGLRAHASNTRQRRAKKHVYPKHEGAPQT